MLINVLDRDLQRVAVISNDTKNAPEFYADEMHEYLNQGAISFDFTVSKFIDGKKQEYVKHLNKYSSFSFEKDGVQYCVFPAGSDGFFENDSIVRFKCLSLDRELSLEYVDKLENTAAHSLGWYFSQMGLITNSQISIGVNEVSTQLITLSYDGQATKLERLISVIGNFGAEFEFVTELENDGSVKKITLNIYKESDGTSDSGIGQVRQDIFLKYGRGVNSIERTVDFTFFNASTVTGKDGLSWKKSAFSYKNADGVEEFYKRAGADTAFAPLSAEEFPAHLKTGATDKWIRKNFDTEYSTASAMWGYMVQQFKANAYPQATYNVSLSAELVRKVYGSSKTPIVIGDYVTLNDENLMSENGEFGLILQTRVIEKITSISNPEKNSITVSNFKELKSEISSDLTAKMNALILANTPYVSEITTNNGTAFKNNATPASTTLTASIYFGQEPTETVADDYSWYQDGVLVGTGKNYTINAKDALETSVFSYTATVNEIIVARKELTITNVNDGAGGKDGTDGKDGKDGDTTYIHIAYATSADGSQGFSTTVSDGKTYLGQYTDTAATASTDYTKYNWSKIQGPSGSDGKDGTDGKDGADGTSGILASITEPTGAFKTENVVWHYIGEADMTASDGTKILTNTQYRWNGTKWVLNLLSAYSIEANTISAITALLGDMKAGSITNDISMTQTVDGIEQKYVGTNVLDSTGNLINIDIYQGDVKIGQNHIAISPTGGLFVINYDENGTALNRSAITEYGVINNDSSGNVSSITSAGMAINDTSDSYTGITASTEVRTGQGELALTGSATTKTVNIKKSFTTHDFTDKLSAYGTSGDFVGRSSQTIAENVKIIDSYTIDAGGSTSGRYLKRLDNVNSINFYQSSTLTKNSDGEDDVSGSYTGKGSITFDGSQLYSSTPMRSATDTAFKNFSPLTNFGLGTTVQSTARYRRVGTEIEFHFRAGTLKTALKANTWANFFQLPSDMIPAYQTVSVGGAMSGVPVLFYVNSTGMVALSFMSDMASAINVMNVAFKFPLE